MKYYSEIISSHQSTKNNQVIKIRKQKRLLKNNRHTHKHEVSNDIFQISKMKSASICSRSMESANDYKLKLMKAKT